MLWKSCRSLLNLFNRIVSSAHLDTRFSASPYCFVIPFNISPWMSYESGINQFNRKLYILAQDPYKKHVPFLHRYLPRRSILQTTSHAVMPRGGNSIGIWFIVFSCTVMLWTRSRPWEMLPASSVPQTTAAIQRRTAYRRGVECVLPYWQCTYLL